MAFQSAKSSKKRKSFLKKRLWKKQRRAFKLLLLKWGLAFLALFMAGLFAVSLVSRFSHANANEKNIII